MSTDGTNPLNTDDSLEKKFEAVIDLISLAKDSSGKPICVTEIALSDGNMQTLYHRFDYSTHIHGVRSISKFIVALCVGNLMLSPSGNKEFCFCPDMKIWPLIEPLVKSIDQRSLSKLKGATIKHLLTQTIGYEHDNLLFSNTLGNADPKDYFDILMKEPIIFENGERFRYSNATAYLLSVVFQEFTGENLYEFAQKNLFSPMNISPRGWTNYGKYCAGATGLKMECVDLHKLGQLLLQNGNWRGRQIISPKFITDMIRPHVVLNSDYSIHSPLSPIAYGYFLWIDSHSNCYASGADGQYMFISPSKKHVLTIFAKQPDTKPLQRAIKTFVDFYL